MSPYEEALINTIRGYYYVRHESPWYRAYIIGLIDALRMWRDYEP